MRQPRPAWWLLVAGLACAGMGGCQSGGRAAPGDLAADTAEPALPSQGLNALAPDRPEPDLDFEAAAAEMEAHFRANPGPLRRPSTPSGQAPVAEPAPAAAPAAPPDPTALATGASPAAEAAPASLDNHLLAAVELLRSEHAEDPRRRALSLAALRAARPDLFPETAETAAPRHAEAADAVRRLTEQLLEEGEVAEAADRVAAELAETRGLRITDAALCLRVGGFGNYDPVPSTRLVAGQAHRLIVYTAVSGFAHRPASASEAGGAQWAVELAEEVSVYLDGPSSMLAVYRPEESIVEHSRVKRREFYLVQQITLPRTLSAGAYVVKVTVRDRTSGAQDERLIPVQIVGNAAAARRG